MLLVLLFFVILIIIIILGVQWYYMEYHNYNHEGPVTSNKTQRLIHFQGHPNESHSLMITQLCNHYNTISSLVKGIPECATRTLANLINLHAVRGNLKDGVLDVETAMVGPLTYYGFIDPKDSHTIVKDIYHRHKISLPLPTKGKLIDKSVRLNIECISGILLKNSDKIYVDENLLVIDSLFKNPGLLNTELDFLDLVVISDAYLYDLSPYHAQLVPNNEPFNFNQKLINNYEHAQHKLRVISYYYGPRYVSEYLMKGNGIFVETHDFIQAITPLYTTCYGYVILGKKHSTTDAEFIAITIPYGYTLLVEPQALHGDSNLVGLYMMAMTGNHTAMSTADTVYLRNRSGNPLPINFIDSFPILNFHMQPLITSNKLSLNDVKKLESEIISQITDPMVVNPIVLNIFK